VTLEIRLHRFKKKIKGGREAGKNTTVGNARTRIRISQWRRGDLGGKAPALQENVKMEVETWEKIVM